MSPKSTQGFNCINVITDSGNERVNVTIYSVSFGGVQCGEKRAAGSVSHSSDELRVVLIIVFLFIGLAVLWQPEIR